MPQQQTLTLPSSPEAHPDLTGGTIVFTGTATVLLRFTILTDPSFLHSG